MIETKKQIITRELIEKEIALKRKVHIKNQLAVLFPYIFLLILYILFFMGSMVLDDEHRGLQIIQLIVLSIMVIIFLVSYFKSYFFYFKAEQYELSVDWITDKGHQAIHNPYRVSYEVSFATKNCIRAGVYALDYDDDDAFREMEIGDKCFVIGRGKKAYCIFNTKYFELDENLQNELRT